MSKSLVVSVLVALLVGVGGTLGVLTVLNEGEFTNARNAEEIQALKDEVAGLKEGLEDEEDLNTEENSEVAQSTSVAETGKPASLVYAGSDLTLMAMDLSTGESSEYLSRDQILAALPDDAATEEMRIEGDIDQSSPGNVGFVVCEGQAGWTSDDGGYFDCYFLNYSAEGAALRVIESLGSNYNVVASDWYDPTHIAFIAMQYSEQGLGTSRYLYHDGSEVRALRDVDIQQFGRGGSYYEDTRVTYSPDGNKVVFLNTTSGRIDENQVLFDFDDTADIYDLVNDQSYLIEHGTFPVWIDNDRVLYTTLDSTHRLGVFDLTTGTSTPLEGSTEDVLYSVPMDDSVYYQAGQDLWRFDLADKSNELFMENASLPVFVSRGILQYTPIIQCPETTPCPSPFNGDDDFGWDWADYKVVYDLALQKEIGRYAQ